MLCGNSLPWVKSTRHLGNKIEDKIDGTRQDMREKGPQFIQKNNEICQEIYFEEERGLHRNIIWWNIIMCCRSSSISVLLKFSSCNFPRLTLIISSTIFIRDSSSGLPALWYFISIIAFMLIDSMLLTFCCSIIFLRLFPVIDLQSFLIQLYRVFNDVFVEFRILCVKLIKRFIWENLVWRVCESGSIRNLWVTVQLHHLSHCDVPCLFYRISFTTKYTPILVNLWRCCSILFLIKIPSC